MATFPGFERPRSNYFKLPNAWTNLTAQMHTWAEHRIVEYVLRHTWGFQEYGITKRITTDEFMHGRYKADGTRMDVGTGLSKQAVIEGIRLAVADGFLVEEVDDSDRGRIRKFYALPMRPESPAETPDVASGDITDAAQMSPAETPEVSPGDRRGSRAIPRTEKETLERQPKKETPRGASNAAPSRPRSTRDPNLMSPQQERDYRTGGKYGHLVQH